jgi:RimJ/RimL family protein N-acetyltransferase
MIVPPSIVVRVARADELELVLSVPTESPYDVRADWEAGSYRPEWTWLALVGGRPVARALWWGWPDGERPVLLEVLDLPGTPDRVEVGAALARAGFAELMSPDDRLATLSVPRDWRDRPVVADTVAALERAGLRLLVERLSLLWSAGAPVPGPSGRLAFRPVDDVGTEALVEVLARVAEGTLDAHTARRVQRVGAERAAGEQLKEMAAYPAPRSWWRLAYTPAGEVVGTVLPSRSGAAQHIVGFLGVVPQHRGRGYVDDLLGECTRLLTAEGAEQIGANTDVANAPMAAAFRRAGYAELERRRLDLV